MLQICSWPDCCHGFLSMSMAALFLISSVILWYLCHGNCWRAWAIAVSSAMYRFCSVLGPRVEERVSTVGSSLTCLHVLIAAPNPTMPFHAELLTVIYAAQFESGCLVISLLVTVCTLFSHGSRVNGWIVSISSIAISLSFSATW